MEETSVAPIAFHEVASLFPMMSREEYEALKADIKANGLREPIWTYQGKIIDGRNRYLACRELGITPVFREWDGVGSLVDVVVSLNLKRRHLTISQKAMIAGEIEKHLAAEAEQRRWANLKHGSLPPDVRFSEHREKGRSSTLAGKQVGISKDTVLAAKSVVKQAPELREAVLVGTLTLAEAHAVAKLPKQQRAEVVRRVSAGEARTAKVALLELRQTAREIQAQAAPHKPVITLASWEQWLADQPLCDLLLTDPPYNTEIEDIHAFAEHWLPAALARVKESGYAYVFVGSYPQELRAYLNVPVPPHLILKQVLVWAYKNTLGPSPAHAYKQNWQAILFYAGRNAPKLHCPSLLEQFAVQEMNAPDGRIKNRYHTWQKPDELAERLIRHSTKPGEMVLDCFAGTGTFLLAAHRLERIALSADCSASMLQIAERRGCTVVGAAARTGAEETEAAPITKGERS